ncbi:MAG: endo,3,4-beta-glycanase [Phenylobacterium sp.]|nr:endo,3,4-beta-glycanase [Phenylobacterium sp.]
MAYQNFSGTWLPESAAPNSWINGSAAGEWLYGTGANDSFNTGGGADTLVGGAGDDYYWLAGPAQQIVETPGGGVDTANIWSSYTLPANVENLIIQNNNTYGAGNDGANIIQGGDGPQYLYGGKGEDVLVGGGGADTFVIVGGEGNKVVQDFQPGADKIRLIGGPTDFATLKAGMTQQGGDVIVNDGGTMIALRNMSIGQLSASDFQLPLNYSTLGSMTFDEEFNSRSTGPGGTWATNIGSGLNGHTLVSNNEAEIYVEPGFAGTGSTSLGLDPFSVANGVMTISANKATAAQASALWGYQYISGMLFSNFTQEYGYFEMKAQLPQGQGLWPAFWLATGATEIDVLEGLGSDTKVPYNAIHAPSGSQAVANYMPTDNGYHTYGTLWTPQTITFYVDGTEIWKVATPSDMNQPMHIIANLALGGAWAGLPDASTPFPAAMNIDYIRAYNLPDTGTSGLVSPPPVTASPPPVSPPPVSPPPVTSTAGSGVITSSGYGSTLVGTAGADTLISNQGGETMTGGAGADVFAIHAKPWTPVHIADFQAGVDKLDFSGLYADGYKGTDPVTDGYVKFMDDGAGGTKVLVDLDGPASGHPWPDYVVNLDHVAPGQLTAASVFGGATASPPPPVSPPPVSPPAAVGQTVTSAGYGSTVKGGAGADTLTSNQGGETMTGGAGADVFAIHSKPWTPVHIADFQLGVDKLDLSGLYADGFKGSDPVADGYVKFMDDGAGGTKVLVDLDGPASGHPWPDYVINLDHVAPGQLTAANVFGGTATASPPPPAAAGVTLTSAFVGDTLTGGAGADTLNASRGQDQLTGGAGHDRFVFGDVPWAPAQITDFTPGQDLLDLRGVFAHANYTGSDPVADHYLSFIADGQGGTTVLFDADGAAPGQQWGLNIIHLQGVDPTTLTSADWLIR